MPFALLLAAGSALVGGALALAARGRPSVLEPVRTFAFAAAAAVVALHLLPDALADLGGRALAWAALGFLLPGLIEAGARAVGAGMHAHGPSGIRVAAEVGFVALVLHSLFEGLALDAVLSAPGAGMDAALALVAHHAPLTAAVTLPFLESGGARLAGTRVLGIAAAGVAGVLLGHAVPGLESRGGEHLVALGAVMAGALLHVVVDEIQPQAFASRRARAVDLSAFSAGVLLAVGAQALAREPGHGGGQVVAAARGLLALGLAAAPAWVLGDVLRAAWASGARTAQGRFALARFGAAPAAALLAFALFGGPGLAVLLLLAAADALAVAEAPGAAGEEAPAPDLATALVQRAGDTLPLRLLGLLLAAGLVATLPGAALAHAGPGALLLSAAALALGAALDPCAALPVAAALVAAGLGPAPALAALAAGGLTASARRAVRQAAGTTGRRTGQLAALAAAAAIALGLATAQRLGWLSPASETAARALARDDAPAAAQLGAAPFALLPLAALAVLAALSAWRAGGRGWFLPLRRVAPHLRRGENASS